MLTETRRLGCCGVAPLLLASILQYEDNQSCKSKTCPLILAVELLLIIACPSYRILRGPFSQEPTPCQAVVETLDSLDDPTENALFFFQRTILLPLLHTRRLHAVIEPRKRSIPDVHLLRCSIARRKESFKGSKEQQMSRGQLEQQQPIQSILKTHESRCFASPVSTHCRGMQKGTVPLPVGRLLATMYVRGSVFTIPDWLFVRSSNLLSGRATVCNLA